MQSHANPDVNSCLVSVWLGSSAAPARAPASQLQGEAVRPASVHKVCRSPRVLQAALGVEPLKHGQSGQGVIGHLHYIPTAIRRNFSGTLGTQWRNRQSAATSHAGSGSALAGNDANPHVFLWLTETTSMLQELEQHWQAVVEALQAQLG